MTSLWNVLEMLELYRTALYQWNLLSVLKVIERYSQAVVLALFWKLAFYYIFLILLFWKILINHFAWMLLCLSLLINFQAFSCFFLQSLLNFLNFWYFLSRYLARCFLTWFRSLSIKKCILLFFCQQIHFFFIKLINWLARAQNNYFHKFILESFFVFSQIWLFEFFRFAHLCFQLIQ
jgi:hypothetical protein